MAYTKATKENKVPVVKPSKNELEAKKNLEIEGYRVNLDSLDVHRLTSELIDKYNQNNDEGIIKSFFKRHKVLGQEKHFRALTDLVFQARVNSSGLTAYKAELMSKQHALENLIIQNIEESRFALERQRETHQTFLETEKSSRQRLRLELEALQHENEKAKHEADKAKYEAEEKKHRATIIKLRGKLISKIIEELNFSDINMKQVLVLIEMVKDAATPEDIMSVEAKLEQLKAEAKKTLAQAEQEETKADWEKYKFEQDSKPPDDV